MTIELRDLRVLSLLAETGSLTRAGQRLHLTQSALSHRLKALESQIGQPLFERKSRPLRLTPGGARLLQLAGQVLPLVRLAEADLKRLATGGAGRLHIVVECHSCFDWLLPAMDAYRPQWPDVELDLSTSMSFDALDALTAGDVDLVITSDPIDEPELRFQPLFRFQILLAVARDHPLAGRPFVRPEDLAGETVIAYPVESARLDIFRRFLTPAGIVPAAVRTSELSVMMVELVKSGRGVAALPNWVLSAALGAGQIAARPLGAAGIWSTLYAATRAAPTGRAYLDAFVDVAAETAARCLSGIDAIG